MKTISILGSGWLGLPLASHLVKQGYHVKASTRSRGRFKAIKTCNVLPFIVDIDQLDQNARTFLDTDILIVNITSKNITAFKELVGKIEDSPVENVIFVSSTSVYHNTNSSVSESDGAENEDSPLLKIENLFCASQRFQTTVIRFAGLIGYSRHPGRFFGERKIPQADTPVNMIHRDDCINIIDNIIRQAAWEEVFNGCADTHPNKREFYSHARQSLGMAEPEFEDISEARFKIVSNKKIKQRLNYSFIHPDLLKLDL